MLARHLFPRRQAEYVLKAFSDTRKGMWKRKEKLANLRLCKEVYKGSHTFTLSLSLSYTHSHTPSCSSSVSQKQEYEGCSILWHIKSLSLRNLTLAASIVQVCGNQISWPCFGVTGKKRNQKPEDGMGRSWFSLEELKLVQRAFSPLIWITPYLWEEGHFLQRRALPGADMSSVAFPLPITRSKAKPHLRDTASIQGQNHVNLHLVYTLDLSYSAASFKFSIMSSGQSLDIYPTLRAAWFLRPEPTGATVVAWASATEISYMCLMALSVCVFVFSLVFHWLHFEKCI